VDKNLLKLLKQLQELKKYLRREDVARAATVAKNMDKEIKKAINLKK
jgi:hypothetical protein